MHHAVHTTTSTNNPLTPPPTSLPSSPQPPPFPQQRYPVEGVAYFLDPTRVLIPSYINLFLALLEMTSAEPLRKQLAISQDKLLILLGAHKQQQQQPAATAAQQQQPQEAAAAAAPAADGSATAGAGGPTPMAVDGTGVAASAGT